MSIGERLREERERLGFTQPAFAGLAETTKKSQIDYEKDLTQPKAGYLAAIAKVGADVLYIVTGMRSDMALAPDERELLALYRSASLTAKMAAVGALQGAMGAASAASKQVIHGSVTGQVVEGGLVNKGPVRIGSKKKDK